MGYFIRSLEQINKRFAQRLPQLTDITYVGEGGLARGLLKILAEELGDMYTIVDYNTAQLLATTAKGPALDSIGYIYNVTRRDLLTPTSQNSFYFYLNTDSNHSPGYSDYAATGSFTIPQNTLVSTRVGYIGELLSFKTSEAVTFEVGDSAKYVAITPLNSTYQSDIGKHQIRYHEYDGTSSGYVYCTNPRTITISRNRESDDQYRERILAAIPFYASSNEIAVRIAALNTNHVRDVHLIERPYGPGTASVIIDVDEAQYEQSSLAIAIVNVDEKRPFGSRVTVELADKLAVDVTFSVILKDTANTFPVERLITDSITNYINGIGIGDSLYISRLLDNAMDVSTDIIDIQLVEVLIGGSSLTKTTYTPKEREVLVPGTILSLTEVEPTP